MVRSVQGYGSKFSPLKESSSQANNEMNIAIRKWGELTDLLPCLEQPADISSLSSQEKTCALAYILQFIHPHLISAKKLKEVKRQICFTSEEDVMHIYDTMLELAQDLFPKYESWDWVHTSIMPDDLNEMMGEKYRSCSLAVISSYLSEFEDSTCCGFLQCLSTELCEEQATLTDMIVCLESSSRDSRLESPKGKELLQHLASAGTTPFKHKKLGQHIAPLLCCSQDSPRARPPSR